jgi:hypothetical protein
MRGLCLKGNWCVQTPTYTKLSNQNVIDWITWYKLVSEHREESIANKVKTCKFMLGWLRCVLFADKLVSNKVR